MKAYPESAITTHPEIVRGIIKHLKSIGVNDITIGDSPGGPFTVNVLKGIYTSTGLIELAEQEDIKLNYNVSSTNIQANTNALICKSFDIIYAVLEADFVINVCKLKTHGMMTLSGAVKNMFGTIPGLTKPEYHMRYPETDIFAQMIVDLCQTVKPDITFVDAIDAMEGDGPSGGTPRNVGLILAGENPFALDVALCNLVNIDTHKVPITKYSVERNLCSGKIEDIEILGDTLPKITDFKMPSSTKSILFEDDIPKAFRSSFKWFSDVFIKPKPVIRTVDCVGCGKCAESCPAKTISIKSKKAIINYKKCIKCYCCHEMCPVKAIDFKRSFITKTRS